MYWYDGKNSFILSLNSKGFQVSRRFRAVGIREEAVGKISPFDNGTVCCRYAETLTDKKSSCSDVLPKDLFYRIIYGVDPSLLFSISLRGFILFNVLSFENSHIMFDLINVCFRKKIMLS